MKCSNLRTTKDNIENLFRQLELTKKKKGIHLIFLTTVEKSSIKSDIYNYKQVVTQKLKHNRAELTKTTNFSKNRTKNKGEDANK